LRKRRVDVDALIVKVGVKGKVCSGYAEALEMCQHERHQLPASKHPAQS
jgi:hypothetical protein